MLDDGVDLYLQSVVLDAQAGVLDRGNHDLLAAFGLDRIRLVVGGECARRDGCRHGKDSPKCRCFHGAKRLFAIDRVADGMVEM